MVFWEHTVYPVVCKYHNAVCTWYQKRDETAVVYTVHPQCCVVSLFVRKHIIHSTVYPHNSLRNGIWSSVGGGVALCPQRGA